MEDVEVWRAAQQLLKMYGNGAKVVAALRADKALTEGDTAAFEDWKRITGAAQMMAYSKGFASIPYDAYLEMTRERAA